MFFKKYIVISFLFINRIQDGMVVREVVYKEQANRFREVIREQYGTQIALAKAIGAKDGSYLTPYVNGRSMIGKILRKKLETVGIDVDYIIGGKRKGESSCSEQNRELYEQCVEKIHEIQMKLMELSTDVLEVNKMISSIKKCVD